MFIGMKATETDMNNLNALSAYFGWTKSKVLREALTEFANKQQAHENVSIEDNKELAQGTNP